MRIFYPLHSLHTFTSWTHRLSVEPGRFTDMADKELAHDVMLEVAGLLRSQDVLLNLKRELRAGDTIGVHDRQWLVTHVTRAAPASGLDRRVVAREIL